jgi:hypothetical protein
MAEMRQTRTKALVTAGMEEVRATMSCRREGIRLKRRKTRKQRRRRSGPAPGRSVTAREMRETTTTMRSNLGGWVGGGLRVARADDGTLCKRSSRGMSWS